ncbi:hypothetical protein [Oxynema sp. CENA135]|nr:hypothetical protein [Oxynema sp. CENA135]
MTQQGADVKPPEQKTFEAGQSPPILQWERSRSPRLFWGAIAA